MTRIIVAAVILCVMALPVILAYAAPTSFATYMLFNFPMLTALILSALLAACVCGISALRKKR